MPFIGVDGCHLKGKYRVVLLSTIAFDGNNDIFPIAYVVVESEGNDCWCWFLRLLDKIVASEGVLIMMSDRQKVCIF